MKDLKVLVCGGREYNDKARIDHILDLLFQSTERPIVIIHGAAPGADSLAGEWAEARNVTVQAFPADWTTYGRRAGFVRNSQMLKEGQPDLVIAFPGGPGTRMMIELARRAHVPVKEVKNY